MTRLKSLVQPLLVGRGSAKKAGEKKRRPELEQALLRVLNGFIVMVYLFWYAFRQPSTTTLTIIEIQILVVSVAFFIFSVALMIRVIQREATSFRLRYLPLVAFYA